LRMLPVLQRLGDAYSFYVVFLFFPVGRIFDVPGPVSSSLIHSLTHSLIHSFIHLFIHSFIYLFIHSFIQSL